MQWFLLIACAIVLAGCQTVASLHMGSPDYHLPRGTELVLRRDIEIPSGSAHVKLQHGKLSGGVNEYRVNCEFRVRDLGPRTVQAGRFTVTRSGDARERAIDPFTIRFYKSIRLEPAEQAGPFYLICQVWADRYRGYSISISEMQEAVGDYFSFPDQPASE